jgi:hypothetical protein
MKKCYNRGNAPGPAHDSMARYTRELIKARMSLTLLFTKLLRMMETRDAVRSYQLWLRAGLGERSERRITLMVGRDWTPP